MTRLTIICLSFIVVSLMFVGQNSTAVTIDDAAGIWLFDESSGDAIDSSGNGNDGTINGATRVNGKIGKALEFDGVDDWVGTRKSASLDNTEAFTVEAWIKPDVADANQVSLGNAVDNFEFDVRNGLSLYVRDQVGWGSPAQSGAGTVPAGVWSHVAGIFDGNEIKVYLNGALKATTPRNTTLVSGDFALNFGTYANGAGWFYDGLLDEVALFNVALEQEDIQAIMNEGLSNMLAVSPSGKLATTWADLKK